MRILHTAHTYAPELNGVAEVLKCISWRLAKKGHDVNVAAGSVPGEPKEQILDGVKVSRFNLKGNEVLGITGDVKAYQGFVTNGKWDLVVMHHSHIWSSDALLDHVSDFKCPFIFVFHGFPVWQYPNYRNYSERLAFVLKRAAVVVGLSPLCEDTAFCKHFGLPAPSIVRNGIDVDEWSRPLIGMRDRWKVGSRPWIVTVGNHNPNKGHKRFFPMIKKLRKTNGELVATMIGRSYPAAKWNLGRFGIAGGCWAQCNIRSHIVPVQLQNTASRPEVVSAIRECDVIAIPSTWEAFPVVGIEAMAAGTPWVSFDVGNIRENSGGFVVRNEEEMVEKIQLLLNDSDLRSELGGQGISRAGEVHDWDAISEQYEQLYLKAVRK